MDAGRYRDLQKSFEQTYRLATEARQKDDFYGLVIGLRQAGQCQMDMVDCCPDSERGQHVSRGKELLEKADFWQKAHPECFANTNRSGGESSKTAYIQGKTGTCFRDIVGCDDIKQFVTKQYIRRFSPRYRTVFEAGRGGRLERGMLLFGLPGTGKTLIARAIATEVNAAFISVKASDLKDRFYGETEKKIQTLYEEAAQKELAIVFIDEIETLLPSRSSQGIQNYESGAVTEFLTVLDGFEKEKMSRVITIGATNYPNRIDSAALRPGRLGAWFRVDLPDGTLRRQLAEKHFAGGYQLEGNALEALVTGTRQFSSADVAAICDRIQDRLADVGMDAVDRGLSEAEVLSACSVVSPEVVQAVLRDSHSSVSQSAVDEISEFEQNYHYRNSRGGILEYMRSLD